MKNGNNASSGPIDSIFKRYNKSEKYFSKGTVTFSLFMIFLLYTGWLNRAERLWTPEHGFGYYLGIVGGTLMLLLVLYPLRKRVKWMQNWFPVKYWFQTHMLFGILGPVLILLHSSYNLASMNGRVALFSMITVALSGLIGRYIYVKIHYGLYGSKAAFDEIRSDSGFLNVNMNMVFRLVPDAEEKLVSFEKSINELVENKGIGYLSRSKLRLSGLNLYKSIESDYRSRVRAVAENQKWTKKRYKKQVQQDVRVLRTHKRALLKLNELNYYERLFSAWHIFHFPLFITMVITSIIHIYAVHVY